MRYSKALRSLSRPLSIVGLATISVVSVVIAAVPGFPFTETFTDTALRDDLMTTATWDTTPPGTLRLGSLESISNVTLSRSELGAGNDAPHETRGIVLGDFDSDGDLDAAVSNVNEVNLVYFNDLGAFSSAPVNLGTDALRSYSIAVGDLDRDGDLDLVAGNARDPNVYYLNNGLGVFDDAVPITDESYRTWPIELVDVDADGDLDLIEGVWGNRNRFYRNLLADSGNLRFADSVLIGTEQLETWALAVGDINGDGFVDFVTGDHGAANHYYLGDGSGGFSAGTEIQGAEILNTFAVALADLDGDGDLDLVEGVQRDGATGQNGETRIYPNDGTGSFGASVLLPGSSTDHATVALLTLDFDRDGDIDILEGNNNGDPNNPGVAQPKRLFLNNGTGTFPTVINFVPSEIERTYGLAAGDLDGDGILDFVAGNQVFTPPAPDPVEGHNSAYYLGGALTGNSFTQLQSQAISLEVDGADVGIRYARILIDHSVPNHAELNFFVSNDDGATWRPMWLNNRVIQFDDINDTRLKWKVEMSTSSPHATQLPTINEFTISGGNSNPQFIGPGPLTGAEGQQIDQSPVFWNFRDNDGDLLTYQIGGLPVGTGLTINRITGELSGTLTAADAAASPITITAFAFDGARYGTGDVILTVSGPGGPDTIPPVITLVGANPQTITTGDAYVELGATATDDVDGEITAFIVIDASAVNTAAAGDYTVTYNVMDAAGNAATEVTRTVTVQDPDTVPPVITLVGANPQTITTGDAYVELGATATDDVDGEITAFIVIDASAVNTTVAGSYMVTYNVMDAAGNAATEATRTVTVQDPVVTPPPAPRSSGGCSVGPSDGTIDPTLPILMLISLLYLRRRRLSET